MEILWRKVKDTDFRGGIATKRSSLLPKFSIRFPHSGGIMAAIMREQHFHQHLAK
jgi:hypothetical protein